MHTDGAHHYVPPRWVLLFAGQPNSTPTLLWSELSALTNPEYPRIHRPSIVSVGVFTVRSGKTSFLASAYSSPGGYRYDPGCMTAADQRAAATAQHLMSLSRSAHRHEWSQAGMVLLINNRQCLHGRSAVAPGEHDRELARVAFRTQAET